MRVWFWTFYGYFSVGASVILASGLVPFKCSGFRHFRVRAWVILGLGLIYFIAGLVGWLVFMAYQPL